MAAKKPLEDPNDPPWGPVGQIQAYGKIAQAFKHATRRQRVAAPVFLGVLVVSWSCHSRSC